MKMKIAIKNDAEAMKGRIRRTLSKEIHAYCYVILDNIGPASVTDVWEALSNETKLGVARGTVFQALFSMVGMGLLERRQVAEIILWNSNTETAILAKKRVQKTIDRLTGAHKNKYLTAWIYWVADNPKIKKDVREFLLKRYKEITE